MDRLHEKNAVTEFCKTGLPEEPLQPFFKIDTLYVYSIFGTRQIFKVTPEDIRVNVADVQLVPVLEALASREGKKLIVTKKKLKSVGKGGQRVEFWQWKNPEDTDDTELVTGSAIASEPVVQDEGPRVVRDGDGSMYYQTTSGDRIHMDYPQGLVNSVNNGEQMAYQTITMRPPNEMWDEPDEDI